MGLVQLVRIDCDFQGCTSWFGPWEHVNDYAITKLVEQAQWRGWGDGGDPLRAAVYCPVHHASVSSYKGASDYQSRSAKKAVTSAGPAR